MKMRQEGFIDPLSLIGLGFLVVSLLVGAVVVNKQNANYDIRNKAAMAEPCKACVGTQCKTIASPPECSPSFNECSSNSQCAIPTPTSTRTHTPVPTSAPTPNCNTGNCFNDCICKGNTSSECSASCWTPTPVPIPTLKPTPIPAPIPKCSDFGVCYHSSYVCEREYGQMDCRDGYVCGVHCTTPTPIPTLTPLRAHICLIRRAGARA